MTLILLVLSLASWLAATIRHLIYVLPFFQQHEYDNARFLKWSISGWRRLVWPIELALALILILFSVSFGHLRGSGVLLVAVLAWVSAIIVGHMLNTKGQVAIVKPLVYTARVRRLIAGALMVVLAEAVVLFGFVYGFSLADFHRGSYSLGNAILYLTSLILLAQLACFNILIANVLLFPVEEMIRRRYVRAAQRRIRLINPVVIGITGSYGKTSTKEILAHILASKHSVLKTPKSYNTLMGICKVIREELEPQHEYFVVELGAYKRGEIAALCRLVKPQIGILTAVGPQHLERFKTIENVARAKNELIEALPPGGIAIFNGDDPICVRLSQEADAHVRLYGLLPGEGAKDLIGQNVTVDLDGTRFEIVHGGESPQAARTTLLGRHNISNILGAILAAMECGIMLRESIRSLITLHPVEHRLQLVKGSGGITYIDDAYNANPVGAAEALDVLAGLEGRKILVTPGFVELGSLESEENRKLGRKAACVCDYVFLVGDANRVADILGGLQQEGFDRNRVFVLENLNQVRHKLKDMARPGDLILFENDLPDIY